MTEYKVFIQLNQERTMLQCKGNDLMIDVIRRYNIKAGLELEKYFFACNGMVIRGDQTLKEVSQGKTEAEVLALLKEDAQNVNYIKESDYVKCEQCFEPAVIEFLKDYWITLSDGKHGKRKIKLLDFVATQLVDQRSIKCSKCNKTRGDVHLNQFYYCFECCKNFCPICKAMHHEHANIVDLSLKQFKCPNHQDQGYAFYCLKCKKNFCTYCTQEHEGHGVVNFGKLQTLGATR